MKTYLKLFLVVAVLLVIIIGFYDLFFIMPKEVTSATKTLVETNTQSLRKVITQGLFGAEFIQPFTDAQKTLADSGKRYVTVNLDKKVITYVDPGNDTIQVPIKKIGDPQGWGGTSAAFIR